MFELIVMIVNKDHASKYLSLAKSAGAISSTTYYGEGTADNKFLRFLELDRKFKEVIFILTESHIADTIIKKVEEDFIDPDTGILYTFDVESINGQKSAEKSDSKGDEKMKAVHTIVDRGLGDEVVEISRELGNKGATIIHGRGAGVPDEDSFFDLHIEPEKELVLMLVENDKVKELVETLTDRLQLKEKNRGIIFTIDVKREVGILK